MDILKIEGNYSAWINVSIILLTASLVFYHMSNVKSINVPKQFAAIISTGLIVINIVFTINSLIPYYTRTNKKLNNDKSEEKIYRDVYFYSGIVFIIIEFLICYYMIKDSYF